MSACEFMMASAYRPRLRPLTTLGRVELNAQQNSVVGRPWQQWVTLVARLVLGVVLVVAGALKVGNLGESVNAVRAYRLLPYDLTTLVGYALPIGEIVLGLAIAVGLFTRWTSLLGALLMLAFIAAIGSAWARGLSLDCGCFGGGGETDPARAFALYPWEILRDVAFMACGVWGVLFPKSPFSADEYLAR